MFAAGGVLSVIAQKILSTDVDLHVFTTLDSLDSLGYPRQDGQMSSDVETVLPLLTHSCSI